MNSNYHKSNKNDKDLSKLYANKKVYFNELFEEGYRINIELSDKIERGNIIILKSGDFDEKKDKR